jgi:hypothetical protein
MEIHPEDYTVDNESDEYLTRVVIDTNSRKFYLYSSDGDTKIVECETVDQFMNVLELVRVVVEDDIVSYCEPVIAS